MRGEEDGTLLQAAQLEGALELGRSETPTAASQANEQASVKSFCVGGEWRGRRNQRKKQFPRET